MSLASTQTLLGAFQPKTKAGKIASAIAIAFVGSIILTLAAKISVPVWPVPVTLQTMAVAAIAGAFGARMGVATVMLYLAQGVAGLPVFAGAFAGMPYVFGPTGGFLIGFIAMAAIIGFFADRGAMRNVFTGFAACMLGGVALFTFGFAWLLTMSGQAGWIDQSNVIGSAFAGAVEPFIIWDTVKMAFAALTVSGGLALLKR